MYQRVLRQEVKPTDLPCITCRRGVLREGLDDVWYRGVHLGRFILETCTECGAQFVEGDNAGAVDRAFARARKAGLLPPPTHPVPKAWIREVRAARKTTKRRPSRVSRAGPSRARKVRPNARHGSRTQSSASTPKRASRKRAST